ncbi:hypothetical protein N7492_010220 [Penicillium capsulatum]|uniref:Uncharacterized protein n=1 Tax=Penicillium capsulatum TaxID=69766 RepID=A0A9W9LF77_9EURO|nr:hypothetical protein N7492_010220 [Penicillium capsulatum]KAJ6112728.1 hypothetical protein N7512_008052 [Penicillium capsulatum]
MTPIRSAALPVAATEHIPRSPTKWSSGEISIAAATIIGLITLAAFLFLAIWYILREARARRRRKMHNQSQDPFCPSSLSLAEDTSKVLDEFLMKDIEPERTSLMFSRSRSPSITYVVDNADARQASTRFYRTSYEASTNTLNNPDALTRVSTDGTRPSLVVSDVSNPQSSTSAQAPSTTPRSSQLYATTSVTTEMTSIFSPGPGSSKTSNSATQRADPPSSSNSSMPPSINLSRPSSQLSRSSPRHSGGRLLSDGESVRQGKTRAHRLSQSTVHSRAGESLASAESPQLPSIPPTPSPLFRFSEA